MGQKLFIIVAILVGFGAGFLVFRQSGSNAESAPPKIVSGPVTPAPASGSTLSTAPATNTAAEADDEIWPPKKPTPEFGPDGKPTAEYSKKLSDYLTRVAGPHTPSEKEIEDSQVLLYRQQLTLERMDPPNTILVRTKGKQAYIEASLEVMRDSMVRSGFPAAKLSPELCKAAARAYMQRKLKTQSTDTARQMARDEALKLGLADLAAERNADERAELDALITSLKTATASPAGLIQKLAPFAPFTENERTRIEAVAADPAGSLELRSALLAQLAKEAGTSPATFKNFLSTATADQIVDVIGRCGAPANENVRRELLEWISSHVSLQSVKALQGLCGTPDTEATARAIFDDKKQPVEIRAEAILALIGAHTPETNASLLKLWSNRDEDPRVRVAALRDEDLGRRDKLHALILDKTENAAVRAAALQAVGLFSYQRSDLADLEPAASDSPEIAAVWEKVSAEVEKLEDRAKH